MPSKSRWILLSLLGGLSFASVTVRSQTTCPHIDVTGPSGIARPGESIRFTASVRGVTDPLRATYLWTLSSGKIVAGQGTRSIVVDNEGGAITATVAIGDLPTDCAKTASEHYGGDPPPSAEKLYEVPSHQVLTELNIGFLSSTLRQRPSDQLYIILHGTNSESNQKRQAELVKAFKSMGIPHDRVTIVSVFREPNVTQFWLVPPGSENPEPGQFEKGDQDAKSCPTITVTGPAGVSMPDDVMTFVTNLSGETPKSVTFWWEVSGGVIIGGQGTPELRARYITVASSFRVTVTVEGLPAGCAKKVSEVLGQSDPQLVPEHLGGINNPSYKIDSALLERIRQALMSEKSSQLYVWVYIGSSSERRSQSIRNQLLRQLTMTKIDPSRFTLRVSSERSTGAIFWRIPPGADNPAP